MVFCIKMSYSTKYSASGFILNAIFLMPFNKLCDVANQCKRQLKLGHQFLNFINTTNKVDYSCFVPVFLFPPNRPNGSFEL